MITFDQIVEKIKAACPELTNTSNASIWQRMAQAISSVFNVMELDMKNSEAVIEYSARNLRVAGKQYYIDMALAFQYGDSIIELDPLTCKYGYKDIDPSKQIIKQVAIRVDAQNGVINMAVCKQAGQGNTQNTPLSAEELEAFKSYVSALSPLGIAINVLSSVPSVVSATKLFIRYINSYSLTAIKSDVKQMLVSAQTSLVGDSPIYVNDIETSLGSIQGVRDAYFQNITCDGIEPTNGYFIPASGYYNFDAVLYDLDASVVIFEPVR